jgi:quinol monooxygenase YgiN
MEKIFGIVDMQIAPGATAEFARAGRACIEAASNDLTGTTLYEWFVSDDGTRAMVIESYDGAEAVALHGRMVGKVIPAVLDVATFEITFAGDVPDAVVARMRERLGKAEVFGARFQGRLTGPAAGVRGPDAGHMIFAIARFSIQPGKREEFDVLAREAFALVEANEPGTHAYEWFLNPAGTECLTLDVYRDVAALKAHMGNAGATMGKLLQIVKSETVIYGALPAEMRAKFKPELGVRYGGEQLGGIM